MPLFRSESVLEMFGAAARAFVPRPAWPQRGIHAALHRMFQVAEVPNSQGGTPLPHTLQTQLTICKKRGDINQKKTGLLLLVEGIN